jgi:hypothetical protein
MLASRTKSWRQVIISTAVAHGAGLAIHVSTVLNREDLQSVTRITESDAIIANPESKLGWLCTHKMLNVAFSGRKEAGQGVQDPNGCGLIDGAKLRLGRCGPVNPLSHAIRRCCV